MKNPPVASPLCQITVWSITGLPGPSMAGSWRGLWPHLPVCPPSLCSSHTSQLPTAPVSYPAGMIPNTISTRAFAFALSGTCSTLIHCVYIFSFLHSGRWANVFFSQRLFPPRKTIPYHSVPLSCFIFSKPSLVPIIPYIYIYLFPLGLSTQMSALCGCGLSQVHGVVPELGQCWTHLVCICGWLCAICV